jgi:anti-sigma factor RsiW
MKNYQPEDARRESFGEREPFEGMPDESEDLLFLEEEDESARRFDLISAYLDNEVTAEERREVQHWLDTDPEAKKLYLRLREVQARFQNVSVPASVDANILADRVFQKVDRRRNRRIFLYGGAAIAAMAIALLSHGLFGRQNPMSQMANHPIDVTRESDSLMIALNHPILDLPEAEEGTRQ